ncbi:hypothetical protein E2C01_041223 [Portunus trituberculatus]|uniref:Uncharacterized protein n=1 Tax=Portunus trituberculatus TaxID=210409 RepID=A0A5B7FPU0_PORTR|nr:hypothetical protein [Portunus trituberculatus]
MKSGRRESKRKRQRVKYTWTVLGIEGGGREKVGDSGSPASPDWQHAEGTAKWDKIKERSIFFVYKA